MGKNSFLCCGVSECSEPKMRGMSLGTAQSISKGCDGQIVTPKALESLDRVWSQKVDHSLEHQLQGHCGVRPWGVSQKIALSGGKCRGSAGEVPGTHPPSPHTGSAQPSLEHVVAQLRASRAGCRDPLPRPGVHQSLRSTQPGRSSACWSRATGSRRRFRPSPQQQPGPSFVGIPPTLDPGSFQQPLPFSAT